MYQTEDGKTRIDIRLENDTVWLTQSQMAELFQRDRSVISKHIKNVFAEGALRPRLNAVSDSCKRCVWLNSGDRPRNSPDFTYSTRDKTHII